MHQAELFV